MVSQAQNSPEMLVEMLLHLGRLAHGDGKAAESSTLLSTAQWTALRYLGNANRFSRTPSAFAEFHGTTRGTASQTIRGLIRQGFLTQSRAAGDGRGRQLDLTKKAKAMRLCDPFEAVVRAAADLPLAVRRQIGQSLAQMLICVAREKGTRTFGTCTSCAHLECNDCDPGAQNTYACGFTQNILFDEDLEQLCINFKQADSPASGSVPTA